ncbi:MAG: hypothetical protein KC978_22240, partial [Candidatus Omnitrophica bacterium]|nr:hypothetical protein [Candidatus Omnitrophota bacterium]
MAKALGRAGSVKKPAFSRSFQRYVISKNYLTQEQVNEIEKAFSESEEPQNLASFLIENNYLTEDQVIQALSDHHKIPYISISDYEIDREILDSVNEETARRYQIIPLDRTEQQLTVAVTDPDNIHHLDEIKLKTKMDVLPVLSLPREIEAAIDKYYASAAEQDVEDSYSQLLGDLEAEELEVVHDAEEEEGDVDTAPVIRLVNMLISEAIRT